jgi:hypothetical protein
MEWVNDELHSERIIVQDIEEDLYDGQVSKRISSVLNFRPLTTDYRYRCPRLLYRYCPFLCKKTGI